VPGRLALAIAKSDGLPVRQNKATKGQLKSEHPHPSRSALYSQPLHVLLVITKGEIGGAQTHVIELCRAMREQVRFTAVIGGEGNSFLQQALQSMG